MKISSNQKILGVVAIVGIAAFLYQRNKEKNLVIGSNTKGPVMTDAASAGFVKEGQWVVGAYDATTNETYVFPEGNIGAGKRIRGRLNVPQGTRYTPSSSAS